MRGGFWLTTVNSSRTDGLTGFTGLFVRPKVRSEARAGTISMLTNTKQKLEVARPAIGSVVSDDEGVVERFGQGAGVETCTKKVPAAKMPVARSS